MKLATEIVCYIDLGRQLIGLDSLGLSKYECCAFLCLNKVGLVPFQLYSLIVFISWILSLFIFHFRSSFNFSAVSHALYAVSK